MLILANVLGFLYANWKRIAYITLGVIVLFLFTIGVMRSCRPGPKLDEISIQKAQQAIKAEDRKQMIEILTESDLAEKQINANLANADNEKLKTLSESRAKYNELSNDDLAAELERRKGW